MSNDSEDSNRRPSYREMEVMNHLIQRYGLEVVVLAIAEICEAKSDSLATHAASRAKQWLAAGTELRAVATTVGDL